MSQNVAKRKFQFSLRALCLGVVAAGMGLGLVIWIGPTLWLYYDFGYIPVRIVETLKDPVAVASWNQDGLVLAHGEQLPLPGIRELPLASTALSAATQFGVERSNGRVIGLIRVWHWCGNDRVRDHVARVDLGHLLEFVGEGDAEHPLDPEYAKFMTRGGGRFSQHGWDVGDFSTFQNYLKLNAGSR